MFRDTFRGRRKREKPNSMRLQPTISFRCSLDGETLGYLKSLKRGKIRSQFINQAISMKYFHDRYHKGFLLQMIQHNFSLCKHLLRQIGSSMSEYENKQANSRGQNTKEREKNAEK